MPILCGKTQRNRQTLADGFYGDGGRFPTAMSLYRFTTLANYSRHAWSVFGANIS